MKEIEVFFDTNVLLYLLSSDEAKASRAEEVIAVGGVISVQVLNELASVASRKLRMSWPEILEVTETSAGGGGSYSFQSGSVPSPVRKKKQKKMEMTEFSVGCKVKHPFFGNGTVTKLSKARSLEKLKLRNFK